MKPSWLQFLIEFTLILIFALGCLFLFALGQEEVPDYIIKIQLLIIAGITILLLAIEIMLCSSKFDALPRIEEGDIKCRKKH